MIEIIRKNFVVIFLIIFTLAVVNSFLYLNKNFYKTEVKTQIVFYDNNDYYENFMIKEFLKVIDLTKSDLTEMMRKLNISYFNSDAKIKSGHNSFKKTDKKTIFYNKIYIYDKFEKEKYEQFILKEFKSNLFKVLSQLKIKKLDRYDVSIRNCLARSAITQTQNPNKNYKEFSNMLDEVKDIIYSESLPFNELTKLFQFTDLDFKKKSIFYNCLKKVTGTSELKNSDLYFIINFNDFQNKNFDIRLDFTNYKNDNLIYFLNLIIIMTFISIYFSIKSIYNFLKRNHIN